ncbi:MAG: hypothetical protein HY898_29885 [Deltaproteobacteria bacterium]|nr:hypothetical protein [Deltaproteobacteria bacterium]
MVEVESEFRLAVDTCSSVGTGFILRAWPACVITAAHNVRLAGVPTPEAVTLAALASDGSRRFRFQAMALAYPTQWRNADLAVIRLAYALEAADAYETAAVPATGDFSLELLSCAMDGPLEATNLEGRYASPWIQYTKGVGAPSMSGGPLLRDGRVVGLHVGQIHAAGRDIDAGFPFDGDLATQCMLATVPRKDEG